jgi:hypothetical protein
VSLAWDVLIPAHNAEATVAVAVASALAQEVPPQHVIVYDDGSTDATAEAARTAGATVIVGPQNRGVGHARRVLLRTAQAPFVHMLDADDRLLPAASVLFEQAVAVHPGAWLIGFRETTDGDATAAGAVLETGREVSLRRLWLRNRFITSSTLIRLAAALQVGSFPAVRQLEDYALWLRMAAEPGARGRLWTHANPVTVRAYDGASLSGDVAGAVRAERELLPQHSDAALAGLPAALRPTVTTARLAGLWWRGLSRHTDYGRPASSFLAPGEIVPGMLVPALLRLAGAGPLRPTLRAAARLGRG